MDFDDAEFEIFDEATTKKIRDEHEKDMADAAKAIGARRMGLITGDMGKSTGAPPAAGRGLMDKLTSATSLFSRKKTPAPAPAAAHAAPTPTPSVPAASEAPAAASNSSAQSSNSPLRPPPPGVTGEGKPEAEAPTSTNDKKGEGRPPREKEVEKEPTPVQEAVTAVTAPEGPDAEKDKGSPALPVPATAAAPAAQAPAGTEAETADPTATGPSKSDKVGVDVDGNRTGSTPTSTAPADSEPAKAASTTPTPTASPDTTAAADAKAEAVLPEMKVMTFEVREQSLGAAVVGHVAILEGSCYVWAATEGSSAQGSLAAAVGTRFDGGMPTATPLLAGEGVGEAGAVGGVSVSMAQRLCRRTGRVVFVSCDLSEDSQILVSAVEAKVIALLKADG
eukprot:g19877.t1